MEEIIRVAEQGPTEGSERVAIDGSTAAAFRQHFSQRMFQVLKEVYPARCCCWSLVWVWNVACVFLSALLPASGCMACNFMCCMCSLLVDAVWTARELKVCVCSAGNFGSDHSQLRGPGQPPKRRGRRRRGRRHSLLRGRRGAGRAQRGPQPLHGHHPGGHQRLRNPGALGFTHDFSRVSGAWILTRASAASCSSPDELPCCRNLARANNDAAYGGRYAAPQVLDSLKVLSVWGGAPDSQATYHDLLMADGSITQALHAPVHSLWLPEGGAAAMHQFLAG